MIFATEITFEAILVFDRSSLTRWLDYLFNIWLFTAIKIYPKANNILPKWRNFAKSSQTGPIKHFGYRPLHNKLLMNDLDYDNGSIALQTIDTRSKSCILEL